MPVAANKPTAQPAIALVDYVATVRCCSWSAELSGDAVSVAAESGGRELGKVACDVCGAEYTLGVLARTLEASRASEVFEQVDGAKLDELGVDRGDYEPSDEEPAMCVGCDGEVDRSGDYCPGCREYVCSACRRYRGIDVRRHPAEAHTTAPKEPKQRVAVGDGTFDDDFVMEDDQ